MPIIGTLPYILSNGNTADATQVMADFNFIVAQVNANATSAGANNSITSLTGLTTPVETTLFGTTTGTASTQNLTVAMPFIALVSGVTVWAKIGAGLDYVSPTLNVNGTGAKSVISVCGSAALSAGRTYMFTYDGTNWVCASPQGLGYGGAPQEVGLKGAYTTTTTATWTATALVLEDTLGGLPFTVTNFSKTLDISGTGAGKLDTGTVANSTWYYVYAIAKADGTQSILATTAGSGAEIYAGANMPSGYVYSKHIGQFRTNGSAQIDATLFVVQFGRTVFTQPVQVLNNGVQTGSYASVSISSAVPPNAKTVTLEMIGGATLTAYLAGDTNGAGRSVIAATNGVYIQSAPVPLITAQTIYYYTTTNPLSLNTILYTF